MSIQTCIKQAADEKLGPLASAIILNGNFSQPGSFDPYYDMLSEELIGTIAQANDYIVAEGAAVLDFSIVGAEKARSFVLMVQNASVGVAPAPSAPKITPFPAPASGTLTIMQPLPDSTGTNSCYNKGCGLKFATFQEAMAHKCLAHGYNQGRWTLGWAKDFMSKYGGSKCPVSGPNAPVASPVSPDPDEEDRSNPAIQTVSARWVPKLNLDLAGLGLAPGEASRFAVGEDENARFFFVRRVRQQTTIKGKFVWTKFAHRFYSERVEIDDFVVRKMAGDTKEWIGMQRRHGVWNPDYTFAPAGQPQIPKYIHEGIYVGEYEEDLEEIIQDPHKARVRYGRLIGSCGYCGRKLTDPLSRSRGIGPDCWEEKYLPSLLRKRGI